MRNRVKIHSPIERCSKGVLLVVSHWVALTSLFACSPSNDKNAPARVNSITRTQEALISQNGFAYSSSLISATKNLAIAPLTPKSMTLKNPTYTVVPSLPRGLLLDSKSGWISGTPTQALGLTSFGIRATSGKSVLTASIGIRVSGASTTASRITGSASEVTADGKSSLSITVTLIDASGNPISGEAVSLHSSRGGTDRITPSSILTNSRGSAGFSITTTTSGSITVFADIPAEKAVLVNTVTANFTPGPVATLTITKAPDRVQAGVPFQITALAKDAFGNGLRNFSSRLLLNTPETPGGSYITPTSSGDGLTLDAPALKVSGISSLRISADHIQSPGKGILVLAGPPVTTTFSVPPPKTTTVNSVLTPAPEVTLLDSFGNLANSSSSTLLLSGYSDSQCTQSVPGGISTEGSSASTATGRAKFQNLRILKTTVGYLGASLNGALAACSKAISVQGGELSGSLSSIRGVGTPVADGRDSLVVSIQLQDGLKNPMVGVVPAFTATDTGSTNTYGKCSATDVAGRSTCSLQTTKVESKVLTLTSPFPLQSAPVSFRPGPASSLVMSGYPESSDAGSSASIKVSVFDAFGNKATGYTGKILFNSSDLNAVRPYSYTFLAADLGERTLPGFSLRSAGLQSFSAVDASNSEVSGSLGGLSVKPTNWSTSQSVLSVSQKTIPSGDSLTVRLTLRDAYGNSSPASLPSAGEVQFFTSLIGGNGSFSEVTEEGGGVFSATFRAVKSGTLIFSAKVSGVQTGGTQTVIAQPGPAVRFAVSGLPDSFVAGAQETLTVTALDGNNNVATGYSGSLNFISSSKDVLAPDSTPFNSGVGKFNLSFTRSGDHTLTITDGSISGSISFTLTPGAFSAASSILSASSDTLTAGQKGTLTLTPMDAYGNSNPTGVPVESRISFALTNEDGGSAEIGSATLSSEGSFTASITGMRSGSISIQSYLASESDSDPPGWIGSPLTLLIIPGEATRLTLNGAPDRTTAGVSFSFRVIASDAYGNQAISHSKKVSFSGSDSKATLPASSNLSKGEGSFSIILKSAGTQTLTATDGTLTSEALSIFVDPAAASSLAFKSISTTATAGTAFNATVTALDAYGNTATSFASAVSITSSDSKATLPASATLTSGVGTFSVTLKTAGSKTITATGGSLTLTSSAITVSPAAYSTATSIVTASSGTVSSGSSLTVTLTAKDSFGNTSPSGLPATSSIAFTSSTVGGTGSFGTLTSAGSGVYTATFTGILAGSVGLGASISGASVSNNTSITVTPGIATKLSITSQPSGGTAGTAWVTQPVIKVQDAQGNTVTSSTASITMAIGTNPGSGTLSGTTSISAVSGVATFSGLSINKSGMGYTLSATSSGLTATSSASFTITAGTASSLYFNSLTTTATAGTSFNASVTALDAYGNTATSFASTVSITSSDSAASLPSAATLTSGVGTFAITLKTAGSKTITATGAGLSITSSVITVSPAAYSTTNSIVTASSGSVSSGSSITVTLTAKDAYGNTSPSGLPAIGSIAFTSSTIGGTGYFGAISNPSLGVYTASFTGAIAGSVTLGATISGSSVSNNTSITVTPGAASKLSITSQPSGGTAGSAWATQPVIKVQDAQGNTVSPSTASIVLTIGTNPGSGTLSGATTISATSGVATFSGLSINKSGSGYTLSAISTGLTGATSSTFNITAGAASALALTTQPSGGTAGAAWATQPAITVQDAYGNAVTSSTASIVLAIGTNPGSGTLSGTTSISAVSGVATFSGLSINKSATGYTLSATSTGLTGVASSSFTITPGAASSLAFSSLSTTATAGTAFNASVTALDAYGNTATSFASTVSITSSDSAATLPSAATLTSGVGTFNITLKTAGSKTITATGGSLTLTSSAITVSPAAYSTATSIVTASNSSVASGSSITVTLTAKDAYGNTSPSGLPATSSIAFTSSTVGGTGSYGAVSNPSLGVYTANFTGVLAGSVTLGASISGASVSNNASVTVTPGAASKLSITSQPSGGTAGTAWTNQPVITVQDAQGNTVTSSTASITLAIGTNPGSGTLSGSLSRAATSGIATFSGLSINKSGNGYTLSASSTGLTGVSSSTFTINPGAASSLAFTSVSTTTTAGSAFNATVTALDAYGNTATSFASTVTITSSDSAAILPSSATLTSGVGTFAVTLKTAGSKTITATGGGFSVTSSAITVNAGAATQLAFGSVPSNTASGTSFSMTLTALDSSGNVATGHTGTVSFSSTDPSAALPSASTLTNGFGTFTFTLNSSGSRTISATDGTRSVTTAAITVSGGVATQLVLTGVPGSATAGNALTFTVTAKDSNNNTVTNFSNSVTITSSDASATLPASATLTNGVGTFNATLNTSGTKTLTATAGTLTITSASINVAAGAVSKYGFTTLPSTAVSGTAFSVAVTAQDVFGNAVSTNTNTVTLTSNDPLGAMPAAAALVAGTKTFSVTLKTAGSFTLTATGNSITSTSSAITVSAGAATKLVITGAPTSASAGTAFTFTVTAKDANNNTATNYSTAVSYTSTDTAATLPTSAPLTNGTGTLSFTLKTVGSKTITATSGTLTSATTAAIAVSAGAATQLVLTLVPTSATAAVSFTINVTAKDSVGNTATTNTSSITITSSDPAGSMPPSATLNSGAKPFAVRFNTAGTQTFTATGGGLTVTSSSISVSPGAMSKFVLTGVPSTASSGVAFPVTLTAQDAVGNLTPSYSGTVSFTSTDTAAVLPGATAITNGTGSFSITLKTSGNKSFTATDGSKSVTSSTIAVSAAATKLVLTGVPSATIAGNSFSFTVSAKDNSNVVSPGFSGTVTITSTDGSAILPTPMTLTNGIGTFSVTLKAAGTKTITASGGGFTVNSSNIAVSAGPYSTATSTLSAGSTSISAGGTSSLTLTTRDAYGNANPSGLPASNLVVFTTSWVGGTGTVSSATALGSGVYGGSFIGNRMGSVTVGATISGVSIANNATIMVSAAGPESSLELSGVPDRQVAGVPFSFSVIAKDAYGNTISTYQKSAQFTSSSTSAGLPPDTTLSQGTATVSASLNTAGSQTITAIGSGSNGLTKGSASVLILPADPVTFGFSAAPALVSANDVFTLEVSALDPFGNVNPDYNPKVDFTTNDPAGWIPPSANLVSGTGKFSFSFRSPGQTFVIYAGDGKIRGMSSKIPVTDSTSPESPGFLVQVLGPREPCAGALLSINGSYKIATSAHCVDGLGAGEILIQFPNGFQATGETVTPHPKFSQDPRNFDLALIGPKGEEIGGNSVIRFPLETYDSSIPAPAEMRGWLRDQIQDIKNQYSLLIEFLDPLRGPDFFPTFDQATQNIATPVWDPVPESAIEVIRQSFNPSGFALAGIHSTLAGEASIGVNLGAKEIISWINGNGYSGKNRVTYAATTIDFAPPDFFSDMQTSGIPTMDSILPLTDCKIRYLGGPTPNSEPIINPKTCEVSNYLDNGYGVCGGLHGEEGGNDYEVTPYFDGQPGEPVILRLMLGWDWSGPC